MDASSATSDPAPDDDDLRQLVGDEPFEGPRSHADAAVLQRKRDALSAAHVQPFSAWRTQTLGAMTRAGVSDPAGRLPEVDPASGGVRSRVVILHAGPEQHLLSANGGSGMVSPDNDDESAARMWRLREAAGLARCDVVEWNVVPWEVGLKLGRPLAAAALGRWLSLLQGPDRVVLLGTAAHKFRPDVIARLGRVHITEAPSPGQMARITSADFEEKIVTALRGR